MTEQQIDRERLRKLADAAARGPWEVDDGGGYDFSVTQGPDGDYIACDVTPRDAEFIAAARTAVPALLDQLDQAEAELDSWMARAYEAEKRAWQAETRLAGWMEHWNATARTGAVDEVAAILEANTRADQAEARIKAVQDVLDTWMTHCQTEQTARALSDIRRALNGYTET